MPRTLPTAARPLAAAAIVLALLGGGAAAAYNADHAFLLGKRSVVLAAAASYPAGGVASIAVGVSFLDGGPSPGERVVVAVDGERAWSGETGLDGFARPEFRFPSEPGPHHIVVEAGGERLEREVVLRDSRLLLLSTDKPLYQPGQALEMRAVLFEGSPLRAASGPVEFSVRDPDGNRLLNETAVADEHGVAVASYPLSDQLPLGTYRVSARAGSRVSEQVVRVDEYVLPLFDLAVEGLRSFYLLGERVEGNVTARYAFGEPVQGTARITYRVWEGVWRETTETRALDGGRAAFSFVAPDAAVGVPGAGGKALIEVRYEVEDVAGHAENESRLVPVAADAFDVRAIADKDVPGTASAWDFVVTRPDGAPVADAYVGVALDKRPVGNATTDPRGVARVTFPFAGEHELTVLVAKDGASATRVFYPQSSPGLKIVASAPRAEAGEDVFFTIHYSGTSRTDAVYWEIEANGRSAAVGRASLADGEALVRVTPAADWAPLATFRAFKVEDDLTTLSGSALLGVVAPAALDVEVTADKREVAPGESVNVTLTARDAGAAARFAVVGFSSVDRSVGEAASRYLTTLTAANARMEADLATPRYQIHEYVYGNASVVPVLTETVVAKGDLGSATSGLAVEDTGAEYTVQAQVVKARAVVGYWITILVGLGALTVAGLSYYAGRLFHARKAFAVAGAFTMAAMGGATWLVVGEHEPVGQSSSTGETQLVGRRAADGNVVEFVGDARGIGGVQDVDAWAVAAPNPPPAMAEQGSPFLLSMDREALTRGDAPEFQHVAVTKAFDDAAAFAALEEARRYFPETWAWEPLVVLDDAGTATLTLVAPDRLTTWDLAAFAHTPDAKLGLGTSNLTVFQPFFVDPDLPVSAVRNDEFPLRVTIYNYENETKSVEVHLFVDDWFTPLGATRERVDVAANGVASVSFPIRPTKVGEWNVSLSAGDGKRWDAVVRPLAIEPDGLPVRAYANGRVDAMSPASYAIALPPDRVPSSEDAWIKIQAGREAIVLDGAESFIRFVSGCGEQSLSLLDVNVLAFANLRAGRGDALPAERELELESIVTQGLAHELQYLVPDPRHGGRGIVWFPSDSEPHAWLTAWGLLTFQDAIDAGFSVDDAILRDMQTWLREEQLADGRWTMTQGEFNNPELAAKDVAATAYVARALLRTGVPASDPSVARALDHVRSHVDEHPRDAYVTALALAALTEAGGKGDLERALGDRLASLAKRENETARWEGDATPIAQKAGDRFAGGFGPFTIETTAYAVMALGKLGGHDAFVADGLEYLLSERRGGAWYGTQDTVVALTAVNEVAKDGPIDALVTVTVDGERAWSGAIDASNRDLTFLVDLRPWTRDGAASVEVALAGEGAARWSVFQEAFVPWGSLAAEAGAAGAAPALFLDVSYDAREVSVGGALTGHARVRYEGEAEVARMVLVELVAPVGFAFRESDFASLVAEDVIDLFEITGRKALVYLGELPRGEAADFEFRLDATMPVKATIVGVRAFDMYDPLVAAEEPPVEVVSR